MIQNNKAIVVKIDNIRRHSNADKLNCVDIFGYNVIVGSDVKLGDVGLYFPSCVQLSEEFCTHNNLLRVKNADGTVSGGMFEESRRVKTMKLRGERSEGFWCPISHLSKFGDYTTLKNGECLDSFGGREICRKYVSKLTLQRIASGKQIKRPESIMMPRHMDTEHFRQNIGSIKIGDILYFTEKIEGSSARVSKTLEEKPLSKVFSLLYKLVSRFIPINNTEWKYTHGSRNVVLDDNCEPIRKSIKDQFVGKLYNGEAVYAECSGYDGSTLIRPAVDNSKISKDFVAQFGKETKWTYGCQPGQYRLFIYRIIQTSTDGKCVELSWPQVKRRCSELGIDHVNDLHSPIIFDGNYESLISLVEKLADGKSELDHHWKEGVIIRVESVSGKTFFLKHKNFTYKVLEGIIKENIIDEEDIS